MLAIVLSVRNTVVSIVKHTTFKKWALIIGSNYQQSDHLVKIRVTIHLRLPGTILLTINSISFTFQSVLACVIKYISTIVKCDVSK